MPTTTRVASFGFVEPQRQVWAHAFYQGGFAHNAIMDHLVRRMLKAPQEHVSGYQAGIAVAPELSGVIVNQLERHVRSVEFANFRNARFKEHRNAAIPYVQHVTMLPIHPGAYRLKEEEGRFFVRFSLWSLQGQPTKEARDQAKERNAEWHEIYPMGPLDAALFRKALKVGNLQFVWQPKARNRKRRWRLQVPCTIEAAPERTEPVVAGIDLGVNHLAVVSVPDLRRCAYFSRHDLRHRQRRFDEKRRQVGQAYGSKATGRLRDKERRFVDTTIDQTVRAIFGWLARFPEVGVIHVERLKGIRAGVDRRSVGGATSRMLSRFPYFRFQTRVKQVAEAEGYQVCEVDPAYTSQTCSRCGKLGKRDGKWFRCECDDPNRPPRCADLNAANNIAQRQPAGVEPPAEDGVLSGE